jgi:hypothetical protein
MVIREYVTIELILTLIEEIQVLQSFTKLFSRHTLTKITWSLLQLSKMLSFLFAAQPVRPLLQLKLK